MRNREDAIECAARRTRHNQTAGNTSGNYASGYMTVVGGLRERSGLLSQRNLQLSATAYQCIYYFLIHEMTGLTENHAEFKLRSKTSNAEALSAVASLRIWLLSNYA